MKGKEGMDVRRDDGEEGRQRRQMEVINMKGEQTDAGERRTIHFLDDQDHSKKCRNLGNKSK